MGIRGGVKNHFVFNTNHFFSALLKFQRFKNGLQEISEIFLSVSRWMLLLSSQVGCFDLDIDPGPQL